MNKDELKNVIFFIVVTMTSMLFFSEASINKALLVLAVFDALFSILTYRQMDLSIDSKKLILLMSAFFASPATLLLNVIILCLLPQIVLIVFTSKNLDIKRITFDNKWFFALMTGGIILAIRHNFCINFTFMNKHTLFAIYFLSVIMFNSVMWFKNNKYKIDKSYFSQFNFNEIMSNVYLSLLAIISIELIFLSRFIYVVIILSIIKGIEITTHKNLNKTIRWKNLLRDDLTGVYNKNNLKRELGDRIGRKEKFSLIMIDLNDFKSINDTYGHVVGDDVLLHFTHLLSRVVRLNDIYRYGGDEFCVLIDNGEVLDRIKSKLNLIFRKTPYLINDSKIYLSASFGVVESDGESTTIEHLIDIADKNMYANKKNKKEVEL